MFRPPNPSYAVSFVQQLRICTARGFLRLRRHWVPDASGVIANSILAIVIGTVFYDLDETTDSLDRRAVLLFFALLHTSMTAAFDVRTYSPACRASLPRMLWRD